MRLLRADEVPSAGVVATFRYSPAGPLFMLAWFSAPIVLALWNWESCWSEARALPWLAWLIVAPVGLLFGGVYWLCASIARDVVVATLLPSNWLVQLADDGFYLQLRSYQNHHFTLDVPTVAFVPFGELASVQRVDESFDTGAHTERTRVRKRWIELTLANVDTMPLAEWLAAERSRPAPVTRTLGVRSSARFQHTPVLVPGPGVVRIEWLRRSLWRALAERAPVAAPGSVALDAPNGRPLELRVEELLARGEPLAAIALAREERRLSLGDAKSLVDRVRNERASAA